MKPEEILNVGFIQFASSPVHFAGLLEIAHDEFLGKKFIFSDCLFEIDFPSFLNDKDGRKQGKLDGDFLTLESCLKQKKKNLATNRKLIANS